MEEKTEQPERQSSQTAKGNFFLMDLRIRLQILGRITVMGFGIYGVDTISW